MGYKKIDPFPPVQTTRLRFTATEAVGEPLIRRFAAFFVDVSVKQPIQAAKATSEPETGNTGAATAWKEIRCWDRRTVGDDWTTLDLDLSPHIPQVGQYEVEFLQTSGASRLEIQSATALLEGVEAPQTCNRRGDTGVFTVSRSQVTEGGEKTLRRCRARLRGADDSAGMVRIRRVF